MKVLSLKEIDELYADPTPDLIKKDMKHLFHTAREYHRLLAAVKGNKTDYNSVDCVLACMAEGEGSDPEVYMAMAKGALDRLRDALKENE